MPNAATEIAWPQNSNMLVKVIVLYVDQRAGAIGISNCRHVQI